MFVYCKTNESPNAVGEVICRANLAKNSDRSWIIRDVGDFCVIEVNSNGHCVAVVYCVSDLVVGVEIDDDCASDVVEPLIKKYSFENVKCLPN